MTEAPVSMDIWPGKEVLTRTSQAAEEWMHPNTIPWIISFEGILTREMCEQITEEMMRERPYSFPHCDAETRECPQSDSLNIIRDLGLAANGWFFEFHLNTRTQAWLQTYRESQSYSQHIDGAPGETRKLTALAILSDPEDYDGGDLQFWVPPNTYIPPKTQGTVVIFPSWIIHQVRPVTSGLRQTINLGYWGPPFR